MTSEASPVITNLQDAADAVVRWYTDPATTPEQRQALVDQLGENARKQ